MPLRRLVLVLGDQLDAHSAAFAGFDPKRDAIWMAETNEEATHVRCHQLRLAFFFSAMRHFRDELKNRGWTIHYHALTTDKRKDSGNSFAEILAVDVRKLKPGTLRYVEPGDYRVAKQLEAAARELEIPAEVVTDTHYFDTTANFRDWAQGRKSLTLEFYYRHLRKREAILMLDDGPEGGTWNFDPDNRATFGRDGPGELPAWPAFQQDATSRQVIALVRERFGDHPGKLERINFPVTRQQAVRLLDDFVAHRLQHFGRYQDALWQGEDLLYHSRLSALLNVKLLSPREVVDAALEAYADGHAPLNSTEGFVRQILGWREFVRGVYWLHMPRYAEHNALRAQLELPEFYWSGETRMACLRDSLRNVLDNGYAHHIQRLMVLGLFAQLYGVHPYKFHEWHLAMYLDAIDWVSLPNTLGMSQFGDGGIVGSKPYCASGNYIAKMSNYCTGCPYNPKETTGDNACPFTTLYYDFLDRHRETLADNRRMTFQLKNLERKSTRELAAVRKRAEDVRANPGTF